MGTSTVDWVPVSVAVKLLEISRQAVYGLCRCGVLQSQRVEKTVLISTWSIDRVVRMRRAQEVLNRAGR